jgi:hypothetical protein
MNRDAYFDLHHTIKSLCISEHLSLFLTHWKEWMKHCFFDKWLFNYEELIEKKVETWNRIETKWLKLRKIDTFNIMNTYIKLKVTIGMGAPINHPGGYIVYLTNDLKESKKQFMKLMGIMRL